jgi:hypothetical protein
MKATKSLLMVIAALLTYASMGAQEDSAHDFKINKAFVDELFRQNSLLFKVVGTTIDHSGVHALAADCEMHIAATPQGIDFGVPNDFVVEPPNECKIPPAGTSDHLPAKKLSTAWIGQIERVMFNGRDQNGDVVSRKCTFTGFPRIFTEHAQTGGENASNPDHVFELHPLLSADCGGANHLSWAGETVTVFAGMRKITPGSAEACIRDRQLEVKVDDHGDYVFRESGANGGGGRCGNFAIVEIVTADFLRQAKGGHTAIARVSADGESSNLTLKLYTIDGSEMDTWLSKNAGHMTSHNRIYAHGLFTYDYFQLKKLVDAKTDLSNWTKIAFPLAFVVYGEADAPPWQVGDEED